jgi:hypothetical protein
MNVGNPAENRTAAILTAFGYLIGSRRHIPGPGDLLALAHNWRTPPLLIEVKRGTGNPWENFRRPDRDAMIELAVERRLIPLLAFWPWAPTPAKHPIWLPAEDWPA